MRMGILCWHFVLYSTLTGEYLGGDGVGAGTRVIAGD